MKPLGDGDTPSLNFAIDELQISARPQLIFSSKFVVCESKLLYERLKSERIKECEHLKGIWLTSHYAYIHVFHFKDYIVQERFLNTKKMIFRVKSKMKWNHNGMKKGHIKKTITTFYMNWYPNTTHPINHILYMHTYFLLNWKPCPKYLAYLFVGTYCTGCKSSIDWHI